MTQTQQPVAVQPDIHAQWDRLCERNRIAARVRGVRVFLFFVMWGLILIGCGMTVGFFTTEQDPLIGGAVAAFVLAVVVYVLATILAGLLECLRLLTELWG